MNKTRFRLFLMAYHMFHLSQLEIATDKAGGKKYDKCD